MTSILLQSNSRAGVEPTAAGDSHKVHIDWTSGPGHTLLQTTTDFQAFMTDSDQRLDPQSYQIRHSQDLIAFIRKDIEKNPLLNKSVNQLCQSIHKLSKSLDSYFAAIGTFVQAKPEITALACDHYTSFVEKLTQLLEDVAIRLEYDAFKYNDYLKRARVLGENVMATGSEAASQERLAESISDLHKDVIDLLRYIHGLFTAKLRGKRQRIRVLMNVFWKPFDDHFSDLKRRLELHHQILENELRHQDTELQISELARARSRIASLKTWLNPPPWQVTFEHLKNKREPLTSNWIIQDTNYDWWRQGRDADDGQQSRILIIQGKPGYGKSVLCAAVIEDLKSQPSVQSPFNPHKLNDDTFFYFFDKQRHLTNDSGAAFRALATQILHSSQASNDFVDLALFCRDLAGSGQPNASNDEVHGLLKCYLDKLPETKLVLDGLDECSDVDHLLRHLDDMASQSKTDIMLSSRPNVAIEFSSCSSVRLLSLNERSHCEDIERYLRPQIQQLIRDGQLISHLSADKIRQILVKRSNFMFLWANLMVSYLQSDFLTPADRNEAIEDTSLFEELEDFYEEIIKQLYRQCRAIKARMNLQRLFSIVAVSLRPLTPSELRAAMAIKIGTPTRKTDYIAKFEKAIIKMSGSLIEVGVEQDVRFIHTSVLEFFRRDPDRSEPSAAPQKRTISIDLETFHGSLAAECLSYLLHDVRHGPLQQTICIKPRAGQVTQTYAFVLYATEFWVSHAERYFGQLLKRSLGGQKAQSQTGALVSMIYTFIQNQLAVTTWIELARTFQGCPRLGTLPERLRHGSRIHSDMADTLVRFDANLKKLDESYGTLLLNDPNEIWEPDIPAFIKSPFWISTDIAAVKTLDYNPASLTSSHKQTHAITIVTRVSKNGKEVGIIKVYPSREFSDAAENPSLSYETYAELIPSLSQEWVATYEINTVKIERKIIAIEVGLPPNQVATRLWRALQAGNRKEFNFPASFSADLRHITILTSLLRINPEDTWNRPESSNFSAQTLLDECTCYHSFRNLPDYRNGLSGAHFQVTDLQKNDENGAVVMRQINNDGSVQEACLTKLPKSTTLQRSHASMVDLWSEKAALLINKPLQDKYSCEEVDDVQLPLMVTRTKESIETHTFKRQLEFREPEHSSKRRK
ncbi:hypothetical protein G7054_g8326 [Neopestalotiopsis clavispora]|nr:hypothetical protein G7054_g8326 [Neopestalotiopsis clavispora]